jgi:hypothetical protein
MSVRLGAAALCRPLKYSRDSGLSGARCSCHADHAAISGAVRLCFAFFSIHSRISPSLFWQVPFSALWDQCPQTQGTAGPAGRRNDIRRACRRQSHGPCRAFAAKSHSRPAARADCAAGFVKSGVCSDIIFLIFGFSVFRRQRAGFYDGTQHCLQNAELQVAHEAFTLVA